MFRLKGEKLNGEEGNKKGEKRGLKLLKA